MFWDILEPGKAREVLMGKLTEWREVFQQQKIATSVEKMAERTTLQSQQPPPKQSPISWKNSKNYSTRAQ